MRTIATLFATSNPVMFDAVGRALRHAGDITFHPARLAATEALTVVRIRHFDVLLLDAEPMAEHAIDTIRSIVALSPATRQLLFKANAIESLLVDVLRAGAAGCVSADAPARDLVRAIRVVHEGDLWAPRKVVARAFGAPAASMPAPLSPREREIVEWMRTGLTNKEIARQLGISDMTVKTHAHNIFQKLEISGRLRLLGLRRDSDRLPRGV